MPAWLSLVLALVIAAVPLVVMLARIEPRLEHIAAQQATQAAWQRKREAATVEFYRQRWPIVMQLAADVPRIERRIDGYHPPRP